MRTNLVRQGHLHVLRVGQTDGVARELVYSADKLDFAVVPEVDVVRRILRVHARRNDKNQVALAHHLHDFNAALDRALDSEPEWLKREDCEALRRPYGECILVLVETYVGDSLIAKHLLKVGRLARGGLRPFLRCHHH